MTFLGAVIAAAIVAAPVASARAQSNYRLAPIGGRTTTLGGTGVVYGRDAAAAYLNPATAVLADDRRLSFAVNFYTVSYVYAPRWYQPGPVDRRFFGDMKLEGDSMHDVEFNAYPSSLCIFFRVGDVPLLIAKTSAKIREQEARLGFCFASVQYQSLHFAAEGFSSASATGVTRQAQSLAQSYSRYAAGPTYAMNVNDALSIGASFHASFASHRSLMAASATTFGSSAGAITSSFYSGSRGDSFQLTALLGATYALGRQKLGIAVESPSLHVYGVGGANRSSHFDGAGRASSVLSATGSFVSKSPLRVSIGTGLERPWGLAELNVSYSHPLGSSYSAELEGHLTEVTPDGIADRKVTLHGSERARGVVNIATGAEIFVSPAVSLLSGLSTDFSAVSDGALRGSVFNYYPSRTNRAAASFGVASHGAGGELLLGSELSVGWGERLSVNAYQLPSEIGTTPHGTYQLLFTIAGATSLYAIKRAVNDVKDAVKPKSK